MAEEMDNMQNNKRAGEEEGEEEIEVVISC